MSTYLSNHWNDVNLVKLDPSPGSAGPFIVTQEAIDSNDSTQIEKLWILRVDGKWIDAVSNFAVPREERVECWFENVSAVMQLLGRLPAHPDVVEMELTGEQKATAIAGLSQMNIESIRQRVRKWKAAHESA